MDYRAVLLHEAAMLKPAAASALSVLLRTFQLGAWMWVLDSACASLWLHPCSPYTNMPVECRIWPELRSQRISKQQVRKRLVDDSSATCSIKAFVQLSASTPR
eukprot:5204484-Amphidinium_carterae.1